jgi:hypothetical protein
VVDRGVTETEGLLPVAGRVVLALLLILFTELDPLRYSCPRVSAN